MKLELVMQTVPVEVDNRHNLSIPGADYLNILRRLNSFHMRVVPHRNFASQFKPGERYVCDLITNKKVIIAIPKYRAIPILGE